MKKNIFILSIALLFFSCWFSLKNATIIILNKITDLTSYQEKSNYGLDKYSLQITDEVDAFDPVSFHENLERVADEHGLFVAKYIYTFDELTNRPLTKCYYSRNTPEIEKKVLLDKRYADLHDNTKMTTDKNDDEYHITSFFLSNSITEVMPLVMDEENHGMYNLLSVSKEKIDQNSISNLKNELIDIYPEINFQTINYSGSESINKYSIYREEISIVISDWNMAFLICLVLFALICSVFLSFRRNVAIYKIEGYSSYTIAFELFFLPLIKATILMSVFMIIVIGIMFNENVYTFKTISFICLMEYFMFFVIMNIVGLSIIAFIEMIPEVSSEKGQNNLKPLYIFSFLTKTIMSVVMLSMLTKVVSNIFDYYTISNRYDYVTNQISELYIFGNEWASNYYSDIDTLNYRNLKKELEKNKGFFRFNNDYLYENEEDMIPCYLVDKNYLIMNKMYSTNIDYENEIVVFLKQGYEYNINKILQFAGNKSFSETDIRVCIYNESPKTYSIEQLLFTDYTDNRPIVYVPEEKGYRGQIEAGCFKFTGSLKDAQEFSNSLFHKYGYEAAFRIVPLVAGYKHYFSYYQTMYFTSFIKCSLLFIIYLLISRLNIIVDIERNKIRYYLAFVEGVSPYNFTQYVTSIGFPYIIGMFICSLFYIRTNKINKYFYLSLLVLLIIELVLALFYKSYGKKMKRF